MGVACGDSLVLSKRKKISNVPKTFMFRDLYFEIAGLFLLSSDSAVVRGIIFCFRVGKTRPTLPMIGLL